MVNKRILEEIEHLHLRIKAIKESRGRQITKNWYINLYKKEIETLKRQIVKGCET